MCFPTTSIPTQYFNVLPLGWASHGMRIAAQKDQDMGRPRSASVSASQAGISISREQHREDMTEAEVLCYEAGRMLPEWCGFDMSPFAQSKRFKIRQLWVQVLALLPNTYVTLIKFLKLTRPQFPPL